ncbi:MAG: PPC domain-containing protein, partial [Planctomycetota bacterium]
MVIAAIRWSLALVCLASSNLAAQEPPKATKPLVLTIPGQILAADAKDAVRQMPCKIHIVNLEKGKSYLVDMTSSDLDSYLRIEDSQGARLDQDDDGGGNLNARIRFTPTKDDAYQIIATTFAGGEGAYTLTVKDANAPVALEKPAPKKPIPPFVRPKNKLPPAEAKGPVDDLKLQPPTDKKPVSVQGRLQDGDPLDPVRKQLAKSYAVELGEGLYTVKLSSGDFDAFLRIVDAQGNELANDDDSGGNLDARIFFVPPAKGVYRIIATSFQGGAGAFQLDIQPSSEFGRAVKYDPKKVNDVAQGFFIASGLTANDPKDA